MINLFKLFVIYRILQKKKDSNEDIKSVYGDYKKDMKKNILIEFIGLAPPYTAIVGYILGAHSLKGYKNFYQKIYELHFPLVLFFFLVLGGLYMVNQFPSKKARISKLERIIRKNDISENFHYILIGFLAGLGYTAIFLAVASLYYIVSMLTLIWSWKTKNEMILILIRKLTQMVVHCGFCFLYITGILMDDRSIAEDRSEMVSQVIIYGYLFGCIFELLVVLVTIVLSLKKGVIMLVKNCCLPEQKNKVKPKTKIDSESLQNAEIKPLNHQSRPEP